MLISDTFNIKINILIVKIINNELNALFWKKKKMIAGNFLVKLCHTIKTLNLYARVFLVK